MLQVDILQDRKIRNQTLPEEVLRGYPTCGIEFYNVHALPSSLLDMAIRESSLIPMTEIRFTQF